MMILPRNIRNYLNGGLRWGNFPQHLSFEKVLENVKLLLDQVGGIINSTLSIFSWGLVFLIGFIYFVFILLDFENLARGFISLFPKTLRPTIRTISMDLDRYMNNYFRGQALIAIKRRYSPLDRVQYHWSSLSYSYGDLYWDPQLHPLYAGTGYHPTRVGQPADGCTDG